VQVDAGRVAVVMNTDSRTDIARAIDGVLSAVGGGSPIVGAGTPIVGVGRSCGGLQRLHASFREALSAVNYSFLRRGDAAGAPVYFDDIGGPGSIVAFPAAYEEELLNKARRGDFGPVARLIDGLIGQNAQALSSTVAMHCFFYNLLSTALKAAEGTGLALADLVDERSIMALGTPQEMKDHVSAIFRRICAATASRREGRAVRARDEILRFIDENCLDNGISLRAIADRFEVSVPYLSRFVKEHTGENFVEYVARRRIARAKEMLATGSATIERVSHEVGYVNPLTFRRAFRKYEGVNPGDYRGTVAAGRAGARERSGQPSYRI